MSVERSGRGVLTTNAAEFYNDYESFINLSVNSGQWSIENNQIISYSWTWNPPASAPYDSRVLQSINFVGTTTNNDELEYGVIVRNYNTNVTYNETSYFPNNTTLPVYDARQYVGGTPLTAYTIYVRRIDGGVLTPSSMETSLIQGRWIFRQVLQQTTAIPEKWLETTTQSIPTYTTQTTMLTTVDYEQYLSTLTVPADVRPAIATLDQLINDLWSLHYIPFVVCFALIMGLAIWLLH